jgi:hypothetical protein
MFPSLLKSNLVLARKRHARGESIPSVPGENLKIGLAELDRHAIYFLFLVFLLVPLVGAALL